MRLHLRPFGDTSRFSDLAEYMENPPFPAPDGMEWVEGEPAEDASVLVQLSLSDQLNAVFEALPLETQADLAPLKAAVKLELDQSRTAIARLIIERAQIPETLESARQEMLAQFPSED